MEGVKMADSNMIKSQLARLRWREPRKQTADRGRTRCGTLAVYAGDLEISSELLAGLDAEHMGKDTLQHLKEGSRRSRRLCLSRGFVHRRCL